MTIATLNYYNDPPLPPGVFLSEKKKTSLGEEGLPHGTVVVLRLVNHVSGKVNPLLLWTSIDLHFHPRDSAVLKSAPIYASFYQLGGLLNDFIQCLDLIYDFRQDQARTCKISDADTDDETSITPRCNEWAMLEPMLEAPVDSAVDAADTSSFNLWENLAGSVVCLLLNLTMADDFRRCWSTWKRCSLPGYSCSHISKPCCNAQCFGVLLRPCVTSEPLEIVGVFHRQLLLLTSPSLCCYRHFALCRSFGACIAMPMPASVRYDMTRITRRTKELFWMQTHLVSQFTLREHLELCQRLRSST